MWYKGEAADKIRERIERTTLASKVQRAQKLTKRKKCKAGSKREGTVMDQKYTHTFLDIFVLTETLTCYANSHRKSEEHLCVFVQ